jgi:hypothetical protein
MAKNIPVARPIVRNDQNENQQQTNWYASLRAPASPTAPPATSKSAGIAGQIAYDQNFFYVCIGVNQWKRIPLTAF